MTVTATKLTVHMNFNNSLNIETKIYINECLQVKVFIKGEELTPQVI
jgi:hypothetical protein